MFSISFSLDKILVLLIIVGTIFSLQRMYENFIDNHQGRMSFPNHTLTSRDKHLNSLHLPHGWRNAYRIGGGSPIFRVPARNEGKSQGLQKILCNYPIKDNTPKYHPFFE